MELWRSVDFQLPPKRSRGRDRWALHHGREHAPSARHCATCMYGSAARLACPAHAATPVLSCITGSGLEPTLHCHRNHTNRRRNSYTTPCALNLERLAGWLQRRRTAILRLEVALLYPDAAALLPQVPAAGGSVHAVAVVGLGCPVLAVVHRAPACPGNQAAHAVWIQHAACLCLPQLLPPLEALQALVLHGHCSDWPYMWLDWRWLGNMQQASGVHAAALLTPLPSPIFSMHSLRGKAVAGQRRDRACCRAGPLLRLSRGADVVCSAVFLACPDPGAWRASGSAG